MNLGLEGLLALSLVTGVGSWVVGTGWARPVTVAHAVAGLAMVVLLPWKVGGPVRSGFRRRRRARWLSAVFGVLVAATIALGVAHATGLWFGVGVGTALWTHVLLGVVAVPLALWHLWTRPVRGARPDLDRRTALSVGVVGAAATAVLATQEGLVRLAGLEGAHRAGTGSHEVATLTPEAMPVVSWLDDAVPAGTVDRPTVVVDGRTVPVTALAARTTPLAATLDCTGGWRSRQRWDVVSLADLVPDGSGRSIKVTSATGYSRLFSRADGARTYVCTGCAGTPLSAGHGAPVRLVAPGRRGPWWVKWVATVERSDRPAWLQLPLPPT